MPKDERTLFIFFFFFFNDTANTEIYTLSLHVALPILRLSMATVGTAFWALARHWPASRSEEHTSELQSRFDLVCRLLLEKKKYLSLLRFRVTTRLHLMFLHLMVAMM